MGRECETYLVPYFSETEFLVRWQLFILQGLRGGKWIYLKQIEKIKP